MKVDPQSRAGSRCRFLRALVISTLGVWAGCKEPTPAERVAAAIETLERSKAVEDRIAATVELGASRDPRAVAPLIRVATNERKSDVTTYLRVAAVHALARIRDPRAAEPLLDMIGTPWGGAELVYDAAAVAIEAIGEPAIPALVRALSYNRCRVAPILNRFATDQAFDALVRCVDDYGCLVECADALGARGDARAIPRLKEKMSGLGPKRAKAAANALEQLGWKPEDEVWATVMRFAKGDEAQVLAHWESSRRWIQRLLVSRVQQLIEEGLFNALWLRRPELIPAALESREGNIELAEAVLNRHEHGWSGAAAEWGRRHGFRVAPRKKEPR